MEGCGAVLECHEQSCCPSERAPTEQIVKGDDKREGEVKEIYDVCQGQGNGDSHRSGGTE